MGSSLAGGGGFAMTFRMRILAILIGAALTLSAARGEKLSAADREALLENLEKLRDAANSRVDARFRMALAAYRDAVASDEAALKFFLDCVAKVNFEAQQKKTSEFIAWKHQEDAKLSEPGFRSALRYQLAWLIVTLEASSDKANLAKITTEAQEIVDSIFNNADKLAGQEQTLSQAATASLFAKRFEIGKLDSNPLPASPVHLDAFYNQLVFPPLRTSGKIEALHAAWIKRIQQETVKVEAWSGRGKSAPKGKHKANQDPSPEFEKFIAETRPDLEWQMEMDLFRNGDESGSAKRMLALLTQYPNHKSYRTWGDDLKNLLAPKPATPPTASTATPGE